MGSSIKIKLLLFALGSSSLFAESTEKQVYIQALEKENSISYEKIINTRAAYITPMCYTKTSDSVETKVFNPCYACHTKGKIPNYVNDSHLQLVYTFPKQAMKNPYTNLFKDKRREVGMMSDRSILDYVRRSNYFSPKGDILLSQELPLTWKGYRPDCYFNFDNEGFDQDRKGGYTGWRAFRYYPFLGTFWPTNGSIDDVLIRLDSLFTQDENKTFDK